MEELLALRKSLAQALSIGLLSTASQDTLIDVSFYIYLEEICLTAIQELESCISDVEKKKETRQSKTRVSFFTAQFNHLLKCRDLHAAISPQAHVDDDITISAHFANRPTSDLLWYQNGTPQLRFAFPPILEDVWAYPQSVDTNDRPAQLFSGSYGLDLLNTRQIVFQGSIGQIPALQMEVGALGRQLVSQIKIVSKDHILGLKVLLVSNIEGILEAHRSLYGPERTNRMKDTLSQLRTALYNNKYNAPSIAEIMEEIVQIENVHIKEAMNMYFLPAIQLLYQPTRSLEETFKTTGKAWVYYGRGCLRLYVPNCPVDPAMKSIVKRERFLRSKSKILDKIESNKLFELQYTGQDSNPIIELLERRLRSLGEEPPNSLIARPAESQMEHLQGDFAILLRTISGQSLDRTLESIIEGKQGYKEEEKLLQKNLEQMIERLKNNYPLYKDIIDPLVGFLYSLKLGFSMAAMGVVNHDTTFKFSDYFLTRTDTLTNDLLNDKPIPQEQLVHKLWSLAMETQVDGHIEMGRPSVLAINTIFHTIYRNWKILTLKEQEEARVNASTYRYRGAEEGDDETEIKEMFPDYSAEDGGENTEGEGKPGGKNHSELALELAKCHTAMLLHEGRPEITIREFVLRAVSLCVKLLRGNAVNAYISPPELELLLPAHILTLKDSEQWLSGHKPATKKYDFYRDENLQQAQTLVGIMDNLYDRVLQLVETWPENVTLQDAQEACQEVMSLPNTTPVAKFLIHIEKLHNVLHEWQGVASKQYSLAEHFDALTQLTISWRRLELQAWPRLFDAEDERCQFEADAWWFYLYESIVANPSQLVESGESLEHHIGGLMATLNSFIQSSTVGQFNARLQLLRVFQEHVSKFLEGQHNLTSSIQNLVSYYTEYNTVFAERIAGARKKAQKEVNEVILLASWKDTNIVALRESARRSHFKLYKIVRRYRAALGEQVLPVLGNMPEKALDTIEPTLTTTMDVIMSPQFETAQTICGTAIDTWLDRPKRLLDVAGTIKSMQRISALQPNIPVAADILDSFASYAVNSIKEFQSLTPAVLTEENKDEVKHLKNRKRIAYTDALKSLRLMGLKSNLSSALLAKQETLEKIFSETFAFNTQDVVDTAGAVKYFNRALERLPSMRKTAQEHSADLSSAEVMRSIGFVEHLVHLSIQQRNEISRSSLDLKTFREMLDTYKTVASCFTEGGEARLHGKEIADDIGYTLIRRLFRWLPGMFDYVLDVLKAHAGFLEEQMTEEVGRFTEWRGVAWNIKRQFSANKVLYNGVWDNTTKHLMETAVSTIDTLTKGLFAMETEYPNIKYLTKQILPMLVSAAGVSKPSNDSSTGSSSIKQLHQSLQETCDSIFVALQQLSAANAAFPTAEDEQGWLLKCQSAAISSIKALHMGDITNKIQKNMSLLVSLQPYTEQTSQVIRAMFAAYSPIIEQYHNVCHEVMSRLASLHRGTCKMSYILGNAATTIGSKGFCTPQEKSEEKGDSGKPESGTGLGEGEGMEDISKDVGADEDLSEVAQEKNKEEGDKEIEDEKDAVDIEDEMEGQMGDMQEKEDGEGDDEGEEKEDEENEMDEETGEVDELDPSAVDEKLWDEKGGDDSREQEGDTKGNKPQDDMEAKKENAKEGKEQDKEDEGNDVKNKEGKEAEEEEEAPADEHDEVNQDDMGVADQHIPEVDTLDLPEDMNLDQEEKEEMGDDDGMDMDDLSDVEDVDKSIEGEDTKEPEEFPDAQVNGEEGPGDEDKPVEESKMGEEEEGEDEGEDDNEGVEDEQPTEEQEQPEDNLLHNKSGESKDAEEAVPSEVQGIEGGSDEQEDKQATSTRQDAGEQQEAQGTQGQGLSENQSDEQTTGQQTAQPDQSRHEDKGEPEQQSVEKNSFRKVGDILERWHRQHKEILDAQEEREQKQGDGMVSFSLVFVLPYLQIFRH